MFAKIQTFHVKESDSHRKGSCLIRLVLSFVVIRRQSELDLCLKLNLRNTPDSVTNLEGPNLHPNRTGGIYFRVYLAFVPLSLGTILTKHICVAFVVLSVISLRLRLVFEISNREGHLAVDL